MSQISHHVGDISRERDVYVICQSGNRSATVTEFLVRAGVSAHSVSGGTSGWIAAGQPVVTGTRPR
jgi:rhodanese-related sulfurtransferase